CRPYAPPADGHSCARRNPGRPPSARRPPGCPWRPYALPADGHSCARRNPGGEGQGQAGRHGLAQARRQFMALSMAGMLLAILSGLCGIGSLTAVVPALEASAQLSDRVAAVTNTDVIMLSELDDAMSDEIIRLQARYDGEEFEAQLLQKQYQVLNRIIERKIQLQEAREKEINVTEEEVDKAWAQVQQNPGAYLPEFIRSRDVFREEMVLRRVAEFEVQRRILVPFEEVRDYYQEREQDFATPPAYHLLRRNNGPGGPQPAPSAPAAPPPNPGFLLPQE
ncbi:MAG: SurA N-terminal domain-containing protein, partial [Nitrospira sp.]|nr:SurA N-terminal domain-containing protein [Nitrospira sp.]